MKYLYQTPLSASLARRLAEAADGFRNVSHVYFIAGYMPPHPIKAFHELSAAEAHLEQLFEQGYTDSDFAIFGPFKTTDELEGLDLVGAEHIESVHMTLHYKDGTKKDVSLPGHIDSIFFNLSAFEKFVFPYYCQLYGVEYAKILRDNLIADYQAAPTNQQTLIATKRPHTGLTIMYELYSAEAFPSPPLYEK